jgi:hypothetical protein
MKAHQALRTLLLTFILIFGSFTSILINNNVRAETPGQTTLYFTNALNGTYDETGLFIQMSLSTPTKQNDSLYPPSLIVVDPTRILPKNRYTVNTEEWIAWMATWLYEFIGNIPIDENYSGGFFDDFGNLDLILPKPLRIVEGYTYNGNDTVTINGDLVYNLYFHSDIKQSKFRDRVEIKLYTMNLNIDDINLTDISLPTLVKNNSAQLTPKLLGDVYNQQVTLPDVSVSIKPGETLIFSVEIVPSNKTLPTLLTKYLDINKILSKLDQMASKWENRTHLKRLQNIGTALKEIISSIMNDSFINISEEDIAAIINAMRSTSIVYDSSQHPSSVLIPAKISEEDIRIYYLHSTEAMDELRPSSTNQSKSSKITLTPLKWETPAFERNKIIKVGNISATLYLDYRNLIRIINLIRGKLTITAVLFDGNTTITSAEKILDRTKFINLIIKPITPISFSFTGSDTEITYGHSLRLEVALKSGTKLGFRTIKLLYDSLQHPSALTVKLEETQNIKILDMTSNPQNSKIIPGGTVEYILNVTSKFADTLSIDYIEREMLGEWEIDVPEPTTVLANSQTTLHIIIKSKNNSTEAYGNSINLVLIAQGNTGYARRGIAAETSTDAIHYNVEILGYSSTINIKKGGEEFFYFIIKNNNTGAIDDTDSYTITATSQNHFPLIPRTSIKDLKRGETTDPTTARVLIQVPKNTSESSDIVTIKVTSDKNSETSVTINVTVTVVSDFFEELYNIFDSAAKSLGLNDIFGSDGAFVLVILLVVIILFILIILTLMMTVKPVQIICTDRIKEIEATEKAIFELTLKIQSKKTRTYEVEAQQTGVPAKWIISVDPAVTIVDGRQSKTVQIAVMPTENAESKDWTQVTVHVKKTGKKKSESIALLAMIKEGKTLLQIQNVSHWPTTFNPGEKITTSFSIMNNGTVTARNVKVFFYLNGKQKNTVEVTIPAGNVADIQMPWIAEKGKNQVRIRLKE